MPKHKFGISLRSKYTGESIILGSQFDTREEAEKWAEKGVCSRCNSINIIHIPSDAIWVDKRRGFVSEDKLELIGLEWKKIMKPYL